MTSIQYRFILASTIILCLALPTWAESKVADPRGYVQVVTEKPITVKVNGLVCSFCAQGIKKRFLALAQVKSVQVSLAKKTVLIELKPNTTISDKAISDTIKEAGYNTVGIER